MEHKQLPAKAPGAPKSKGKGGKSKITAEPSTGSWRTTETETVEIKAVRTVTATGVRIGWEDDDNDEDFKPEDDEIEEIPAPRCQAL